MSKTSELAELASTINVTLNTGPTSANTVGIDFLTIKKLIVTDGRPGNTEFDGGNTAYPSIELLSGDPTNLTQKYTPAIKFGATDANFRTQNPKFGAAIVAEATQNYPNDTNGGMALSFWTSPTNPGAETNLRQRLTIESGGTIRVNNNLGIAWQNSDFSFSTAGSNRAGARLLKFTDDRLYIDNYDAGDIMLRTGLASFNTALRIYGSNTDVEIFNNLTTANTTVNQDLYLNAGYGSAAKIYGCRAWISFNGGADAIGTQGASTPSIHKSANITSLTDLGVGRYRVDFENPMPDTRYTLCGSAGTGVDNLFTVISHDGTVARTVNNMEFHVSYVNGSTGRYDTFVVNAMFFR